MEKNKSSLRDTIQNPQKLSSNTIVSFLLWRKINPLQPKFGVRE